MYEYKTVTVPYEKGMKSQQGENFKRCMDIVREHAKEGWRLVQIFEPSNEKANLVPYAYEVILERKLAE